MVAAETNMTDSFEVVLGTYEGFVVGYKIENIVDEYHMEKSFITRSHLRSVDSLASSKYYLASAGVNSISLFDMKHRIESGQLVHHNDKVNCLTYTPDSSHLFTCSNDGTIAGIRCGNWQTELHLQKPHNGEAVNTLAIHPTGKMALSTGRDGVLRTWNLIKGRQAYATNLVSKLNKFYAKSVDLLRWSPNGEKYLLASENKVYIYSLEAAGVINEVEFSAHIACVEFLRDDLIVVGLPTGQIVFYDFEKNVKTLEEKVYDSRVKCIAPRGNLLVTASSLGEVKIWQYSEDKLSILCKTSCDTRITCMTLVKSCKKINHNKEKIKIQDNVEKNKKFRLKQEVIVEMEEDDLNLADTKKHKKKKLKRTSTEAEIEVEEILEPKKKVRNSNENESSHSKKRSRETSTEESNVKNKNKKKKLVNVHKEISNNSKKRKELINETTESEILPKKKKKDSSTISNIKKKKNIESTTQFKVSEDRNNDTTKKKKAKKRKEIK